MIAYTQQDLIDSNFNDLGLAIVRTAMEDYLKARRHRCEKYNKHISYAKPKYNPYRYSAFKQGISVSHDPNWYLKWFRSRWFHTICRIDPEVLIFGLDQRFEEWKKSGYEGRALLENDKKDEVVEGSWIPHGHRIRKGRTRV